MKNDKNRTRKKEWQKADARVLGQILAAQNIDFVLPDVTHIAEFFAQTFVTIPGISSCRVCLQGVTVQKGEMDSAVCEECMVSRMKAAGQEELSPVLPGLDFKCGLDETPGTHVNPVASLDHHFGFLIFRVSDAAVFDVYKPFISNLANYMALSLENRLQRNLLQESQAELERKVVERTRDLVTANSRLKEEVEIRRQAEEALRLSERQVKQLIEASPVAMVVSSGMDERVEYINAKFVELFGYTIDDIPDAEHWWPLAYRDLEYREEMKTRWITSSQRAIREKGQIKPMEATVRCKDGSSRYVEFRLSSIGEKHLVTFVDLTGHKQAEEALAESEQKLRTVFDTMEEALTLNELVFDENGEIVDYRILEANAAFEQIMSLAHGQAVGRSATELYGMSSESINSFWREHLHDEHAIKTDMYVEQIKAWKHISTSIPIHNRFVVSFFDITELKDKESALRESEEKYRLLHENAGVGIGYYRPDGQVISYNQLAASHMQGKPEDYQGKSIYEIFPRQEADIYMERIRRSLTAETSLQYEDPVDLPSGEKWFLSVFTRIRDAHQKVIGVQIISQDVTELKRAEQERLAHLRFFESMDQVNRAIQATNDLEQMMSNVLDLVLSTFECDRAFLLYPCDPDASSWFSPMERTRPEYPGVLALDMDELPIDADVAETFRILLGADGPVKFGPGSVNPLPADVAERFSIKSFMSMALYPKLDKPWQFGVHQCSYARLWTPEDERLFQEIGRRLSDALTSLLTYRNLEESELRYRQIFENTSDIIMISEVTEDGRFELTDCNPAWGKIVGLDSSALIGRSINEFSATDETSRMLLARYRECMEKRVPLDGELELITPTGHWYVDTTLTPLMNAAGQVYRIIGISRNITERKQHEIEREAIASVSTALRKATTRAEILTVILDQVKTLFEADGSMIMLPNPVLGGVTVEMGRGSVGERFTGLNIPPGVGAGASVIASRKPYLNNRADDDPLFHRPDLLGSACCVACVPLIVQERASGALMIARQAGIEEEDVRLLNAIADIAANAIHRVTLYERTEQQLHHLMALHQIDVAISTNFDLSITLKVLLRNVKDELDVDAASILLLDPVTHTLDYAAGIGFGTRWIEQSQVRIGDEFAGRAAQEHRTVSCPDLRRASAIFGRASLLADEEFVSHYATPLIIKGQVKGVLEVFHRGMLEHEYGWIDYFETLATQAAIAIESASLFESLQRSNMELTLAYDATIEGWSRALDLRDRETEGHTQRVAHMSLELAEKMGMSDTEKLDLRRGALLHDIGKMGIPDAILLKPGLLSETEWQVMREHPAYAYQMLSPISYLKRALEISYCHHEKWDGSGYPRGLKGEEIPLSARVFAVVDVFDALTSDRPYRAAWSHEQAYRYIQEQAGRQFDPQVVKVFLESRPQGG